MLGNCRTRPAPSSPRGVHLMGGVVHLLTPLTVSPEDCIICENRTFSVYLGKTFPVFLSSYLKARIRRYRISCQPLSKHQCFGFLNFFSLKPPKVCLRFLVISEKFGFLVVFKLPPGSEDQNASVISRKQSKILRLNRFFLRGGLHELHLNRTTHLI